jgi:hypothetical protein
MATSLTVDHRDFDRSINNLLEMGNVRRRDIAKIFKDADREIINKAKGLAGRSEKGVQSNRRYPSRNHPAGNLRRSIVFRTSKRYKLVYYVIVKAWYDQIYIGGTKFYKPPKEHPFIRNAVAMTNTSVTNKIRDALGKLTQKTAHNV